MDEFYDPSMDERDELWVQNYFSMYIKSENYDIGKGDDRKSEEMDVEDNQPQNPTKQRKTDAVLCCPNCFTTVCTECRL